jgi:hypothetical protein
MIDEIELPLESPNATVAYNMDTNMSMLGSETNWMNPGDLPAVGFRLK